MVSIQERLQMKREPLDKWSTREQLCLASAVVRSGDQNWMSVSRALKPFGDANRPSDWFHQKNCAAQYGALLAKVEKPKRTKRLSGTEPPIDPPSQTILKKLIADRHAELQQLLQDEKAEYLKLQEDMALLQAGNVSEEQLDKWCKEIDDEEYKKEQDALTHSQWLKERELKKLEIERAWRPTKPPQPPVGQKRKHSDSFENEEEEPSTQEQPKPALSPLLTSLLKSPSQTQSTPSILHSAITQARSNSNTNPMIASLLNSSTNVPVSPSLQQIVNTAIGQEASEQQAVQDILDDALPNLKLDDLANSILVQDGPLPEIKKEEVDDIISEIIENAHDIVADPEQHLQLDGNGDINIELELDELEEEEAKEPKPQTPEVDPFEFQEDPVIEPKTPSKAFVVQPEEKEEEKETKPEPEPKPEPEVKEEIEEKPEEKPDETVLELKDEKVETTISASDLTEPIYDDVSMEVKVDKTGKAKRDYSRPKKKEEKSFAMLLEIEKQQLEDNEMEGGEDAFSDEVEDKKKKDERSNSPWTEEEDGVNTRSSRRRNSTPATPIDSVPNSPASSYDDDKDHKIWKKSVLLVYQRLATHKFASLFLKPITDDQAANYSSLIHRPMDLSTIKKNIENGTLRTTEEFRRDVLLMFTNAVMYNTTEGTIYKMAVQMQQESMEAIDILAQAQESDQPSRRETRTSESGTKRKRNDEVFSKAKKRKDD